MLAAMAFIPAGDSAGKILVVSHDATPLFIAWSRFAIGAALIIPFAHKLRIDWQIFVDWRVWLRAMLIAGAISLILTSLETEEIANVYGAFFIGPVVAYFGAAVFLREQISRMRTVLLVIGFAGVLIVVRPGFNYSGGIYFAVGAGICYGLFLITNRWLAVDWRPSSLLISQLVLGSLLLIPAGMADIPEISGQSSMIILLSALCSAAGNILLLFAGRMMHASRLAPLVYFQLVAATTLGIFIFGDQPDLLSWIGILIILISGFATFIFDDTRRSRG